MVFPTELHSLAFISYSLISITRHKSKRKQGIRARKAVDVAQVAFEHVRQHVSCALSPQCPDSGRGNFLSFQIFTMFKDIS